MASQGLAGVARRGSARHGVVGLGSARQVWLGSSRQGSVGLGTAGKARQGKAEFGGVGQGRYGSTRHGVVGQTFIFNKEKS